MSDAERLGVGLFCLVTTLPLLAGGVIGWKLRGRKIAHGWPWMLLPKFLRDAIKEAGK